MNFYLLYVHFLRKTKRKQKYSSVQKFSTSEKNLHNRQTRALYFLQYLLPLYPRWTNLIKRRDISYKWEQILIWRRSPCEQTIIIFTKIVMWCKQLFRSNPFTLWSKTLSINAQHYRLKIINGIAVFMLFLILNRFLNIQKETIAK